jgi:hypothetical protein
VCWLGTIFNVNILIGANEKLQHLALLSAQAAVGCPVPVQQVADVERHANQELFLLANNARTLFKTS